MFFTVYDLDSFSYFLEVTLMKQFSSNSVEGGASLRKRLLYAGVFLLLASLVFLVASAAMQTREKRRFKNVLGSWDITVSLENETTYILDIMSSSQWKDDFTNGGYNTAQPVDLAVVSPCGNETGIQVFFVARYSESQYYPGTFPSLVYVEYGSVDADCLKVDRSYPQVRFTVIRGGNYTARIISDTLNWTTGPPREIVIYKEIMEIQPLYAVFLQGSGALCIAGAVLSVVGAKARPRKKLRLKERTKQK